MTPDRILKRYFPALTLLLIALIAYLQARGLAQLLVLALDGPFERDSSPPARASTPPPAPAPKNAQPIVDRNPFDSRHVPLGRLPRDSASPADVADPLSWPACQDVQVVIVTESRDSSWSLATLRGPGEARPRSRRVGDSVANKQVAFIGYNPRQQAPAVWLQGDGTLCQTLLFRPLPEPDPAPVTIPTPVPAARASLALLRSVRVVPEQKGGKLVGLRLFGIRPNSLLNTLGLHNGDRLESINGFEIADPKKALEAYARLSTAKRLHVRLDRSGRPMEIDLNIL